MPLTVHLSACDSAFNALIAQALLKVTSLWPGATQWRIYYPWMWGQSPTTCSSANEVAQWAAPSCRPEPAMDNGVRDGRPNWLAVTPHPSQCSTLWAPLAYYKWGLQISRLAAAIGIQTQWPLECQVNALPMRYSGCKHIACRYITLYTVTKNEICYCILN